MVVVVVVVVVYIIKMCSNVPGVRYGETANNALVPHSQKAMKQHCKNKSGHTCMECAKKNHDKLIHKCPGRNKKKRVFVSAGRLCPMPVDHYLRSIFLA